MEVLSKQTLSGKTIVIGITGSIAAVEDVKLIRAMRRKGAVVKGVMSKAACGIITPQAIEYACADRPITEITGSVEHVGFCGIGGCADVLLIAPATANTICKIAAGIDDTPITTFATTALGRRMPIVIAPAMHESMYSHPAVIESIEKLKKWGVVFVDPYFAENKAKFALSDEIILAVERECGTKPLLNKKVLITAGACREEVDDVRILTTRSSGKIGIELALEAYRLGADVTVVHNDNIKIPLVNSIIIDCAEDMRKVVLAEIAKGYDYYISAAAVSDYKPEKFNGKIESGQDINIKLIQLPKILEEVLKLGQSKTTQSCLKTIAFKLGDNADEMAKKMINSGVYMICANGSDNLGSDQGKYNLHTKSGIYNVSGTKEEVASVIWNHLY